MIGPKFGIDTAWYGSVRVRTNCRKENWMNKRRGRPKTDVARTRRLETRINEEDYNDLLFLCNKTGMSKSDLLRKALREYIDRLKKWY